MEKILSSLTVNDSKSVNDSEFNFLKIKKEISKDELYKISKGEITLLTNYLTYDMSYITNNLFLYSLSIYGIKENQDIEKQYSNYLINKIKIDTNFKKEIESLFKKNYGIAGNTLYGVPFEDELEYTFHFKILLESNQIFLIKNFEKEEYQSDTFQDDLYILKISKKFRVNSINSYNSDIIEADRLKIINYLNILISDNLKKIGYRRTVESRKSIYYKDLASLKCRISIENSMYFNNSYAVTNYYYGYQASTNYYQQNELLLKINPRFRLLRDQTYLDLYEDLAYKYGPIKAKQLFSEICIGRKGMKTYDQRFIKIDYVIEDHPNNLPLFNKSGKLINLFEYYLETYAIKIENKVQLIFCRKDKSTNYQTGKKEEITLYFFPQYIKICGLLPNETIDTRKLDRRPEEKLDLLLAFSRELNRVRLDKPDNDTNINFTHVKLKASVLLEPQLRFKSNSEKPDYRGEFNCVNEPIVNENLKNWLLILIDCNLNEAEEIFNKMVQSGSSLNMKLSQPEIQEIKILPGPNFKYDLDNALHSLVEMEKIEKKGYEIVYFFISNYLKPSYSSIKDCYYNSGFKVPSQVVVKNKALKVGQKYYTNILFQTWAKRDWPVWRISMDSQLSSTIIISYAVNFNKSNRKNLTTMCFSYDKYLSNFVYISEYDDEGNANFISTKIQKIFTTGFKQAKKNFAHFNKNKPIENIIIYREGLNESQRTTIMNFEFEALKNAIQEIYAGKNLPKLCLIFVNKFNDTKLFETSAKIPEGIEFYKQVQQVQISNSPVGTLVYDKITLKNASEFYLNSSYTAQGTSNPTRYVIEFDTTELPLYVIYQLTYFLTYLYYNTTKSIRFPAPLHSVIRRNKHIIDHITNFSKNCFQKYNFSL